MNPIDQAAARARELAAFSRRMTQGTRLNPDAFYEARDELAVRLERLADDLEGSLGTRPRPLPSPPAPIARGTIRPGTIYRGRQAITVEVRGRRRG